MALKLFPVFTFAHTPGLSNPGGKIRPNAWGTGVGEGVLVGVAVGVLLGLGVLVGVAVYVGEGVSVGTTAGGGVDVLRGCMVCVATTVACLVVPILGVGVPSQAAHRRLANANRDRHRFILETPPTR